MEKAPKENSKSISEKAEKDIALNELVDATGLEDAARVEEVVQDVMDSYDQGLMFSKPKIVVNLEMKPKAEVKKPEAKKPEAK